MAAIDIVRSILAGDTEGAMAECKMELEARSQEVVEQGRAYVLNSIGDGNQGDNEE